MPAYFERISRKIARLWAVEEIPVLLLFEKAIFEAGIEKVKTEDLSWRAVPTGMHIPFVVIRLLLSRSWRRNYYWKTLLMTNLTGMMMRWMGYYFIICRKL